MNTIRKWIRNVFGFSGREINGFIVLLPLMFIIVMAQPLYRFWLTHRSVDFSTEERQLDSLAHLLDSRATDNQSPEKQVTLFFFDPNHTSVSDLQKLGFSKNLSSRIASYRQKGGQFRVKSDLLKIYGIDSTLYHQLYPYIQLPEQGEKKYAVTKSQLDPQRKILPLFDLNHADTTQLISVYGIGPALAARIIKFRNGLGGFIRQEQLNEVYGLDSTAVNELIKKTFISENFVPRKIDMNTASEKELSDHPYIKKSLAKAIVAYRFQHGDFTHVEDLRKLSLLKPEQADRIMAYLKIGE